MRTILSRSWPVLLLSLALACAAPAAAPEQRRPLTPEEERVLVLSNNPADNALLREHGQVLQVARVAGTYEVKILAASLGGNVVELYSTSRGSETQHATYTYGANYQSYSTPERTEKWSSTTAIIYCVPEDVLAELRK
jgi:hypothetical protein